ncbi:hypothetical protein BZA05DRAFT_143653 [Tricharina praecox]|uniref:uncharacterized protein n=1 Tax=Tricharina praecox TaxID=43433 RepID=UPI00221FCDFE|nr:uncharacterized protein BZA05DRAFT_143653 [Tricharina praecox]KAI5845965.1 hypothetical protein BZA05DRAFT_143653 [Tricharina praecox]
MGYLFFTAFRLWFVLSGWDLLKRILALILFCLFSSFFWFTMRLATYMAQLFSVNSFLRYLIRPLRCCFPIAAYAQFSHCCTISSCFLHFFLFSQFLSSVSYRVVSVSVFVRSIIVCFSGLFFFSLA